MVDFTSFTHCISIDSIQKHANFCKDPVIGHLEFVCRHRILKSVYSILGYNYTVRFIALILCIGALLSCKFESDKISINEFE